MHAPLKTGSQPTRTPSLFNQSFLHCLLVFLLQAVVVSQSASAQVLSNGQVFTNGLAIVDSPAPLSDQHAGSNLVIAIDISGDGKLPQAASIPGSGLTTRFDALEIYLLSSQTKTNLTVSNTTALLTQESGSTVKHLNWPIPTCVPAGQYNLTFYENSHINGTAYFSITPVPVSLLNDKQSGTCQGENRLDAQPQVSSPPALNPFTTSTVSSPTPSNSASSAPASISLGSSVSGALALMASFVIGRLL